VSWAAILALAAGTYVLKAVGPVLLGGRSLSPGLTRVIGLLPPAVLAGLVAVQTFSAAGALVFDARVAGLAAAGVAVWRRWPFLAVVILAVAATATVRFLAP
jgi:uncharacterized membrane protein